MSRRLRAFRVRVSPRRRLRAFRVRVPRRRHVPRPRSIVVFRVCRRARLRFPARRALRRRALPRGSSRRLPQTHLFSRAFHPRRQQRAHRAHGGVIGIFKVVRAHFPTPRRAILRAKDVLDRLGNLRVIRGVIAETTKRLHELAHEVHVPRPAFHVAPRVREVREEELPLASPILAAEAISTPRRRGEYLVGDEIGVRLEIGRGANVLGV